MTNEELIMNCALSKCKDCKHGMYECEQFIRKTGKSPFQFVYDNDMQKLGEEFLKSKAEKF